MKPNNVVLEKYLIFFNSFADSSTLTTYYSKQSISIFKNNAPKNTLPNRNKIIVFYIYIYIQNYLFYFFIKNPS